MNVFSELVHSIYDCKSYKAFLNDKKRKTFLFGFLLVLIYFLVTIIVPFVRFQMSTGGIVRLADEVIPDFSIADGRLSVERQFEFEEGDTYVYVNTEEPGIAEDEILENLYQYGTVIIADSQNVIIKSNGQVETLMMSDLDLEITKDELIQTFRPFVTIDCGHSGADFSLYGGNILFRGDICCLARDDSGFLHADKADIR